MRGESEIVVDRKWRRYPQHTTKCRCFYLPSPGVCFFAIRRAKQTDHNSHCHIGPMQPLAVIKKGHRRAREKTEKAIPRCERV
uniref:Uncharacterized protein n=1 Tax=Knipowitschia caucasica TaxID=637954 RepID=A0AAV2JXA6_KNICA